jgi:predicted HAD superfamily Cof-like phosphohydrolase
MTMFDDIKAFHEKFELQYNGPPRQLPEEFAKFRTGFLGEELGEYAVDEETQELLVDLVKENLIPKPLDKQLDALVDLVYVALGSAYLQGFDFDEAWRRVHEANMKKVRAMRTVDSKRGSTYDVIKPQGWSPPDLSDLVSAVPNAPPASTSER